MHSSAHGLGVAVPVGVRHRSEANGVHRGRSGRRGEDDVLPEVAVIDAEVPRRGGSRVGLGDDLSLPVRPHRDQCGGPADEDGGAHGAGSDRCLQVICRHSNWKCHFFCLFSALKEKEINNTEIDIPCVLNNSRVPVLLTYLLLHYSVS